MQVQAIIVRMLGVLFNLRILAPIPISNQEVLTECLLWIATKASEIKESYKETWK